MLIHSKDCNGNLTIKDFSPFEIVPVFGINGKNLVVTQISIIENNTKISKKPEFTCQKCNQTVLIPCLRCPECRNIKTVDQMVILTGPEVLMCSSCQKRYFPEHSVEELSASSLKF